MPRRKLNVKHLDKFYLPSIPNGRPRAKPFDYYVGIYRSVEPGGELDRLIAGKFTTASAIAAPVKLRIHKSVSGLNMNAELWKEGNVTETRDWLASTPYQ